MMWETKPLLKVIQKTENKDPRKEPDKPFVYIDVSSVSRQTFQIEETTEIKGIDAPSRARKLVKAGDVIFATIRPTLKRIAVIPDELDGQICSTGYFVFRPKPEIYNRYLFYYLLGEHFSSQMEMLQKGASYPAVNDTEVKTQEITYPPLEEQKRIVAILDEAFAGVDQAIANTEQNIQNARELFESYLNTLFTQKGEGWEDKKLVDITDKLGDGLHGTPKYSEEGEYYFINGNNLNNGVIEYKERTKKVSAKEFEKHKKELNDRTVLVSINGTLGKVAFYNDEKIILGKSACYFNLHENINKNYIKHVISSPYFIKYAHREATGATIKNVSLKSMRNFLIPLPPSNEQEVIADKLDTLENSAQEIIKINNQKLTALIELKQSLLQKAFAGELTSDLSEAA